MCDCADGQEIKESFLKQFLKDAERHLKKVAEDYVRPDCGTTAFALVFVPSEAVYYVLATQGYDLLRKHLQLGVQVVSPLLLGHKLELLKLGIQAMRLNENAKEVLVALQRVGRCFNGVEEAWRVFHATHLRNLEMKASEIDEAYKYLDREFQRIAIDISPRGEARPLRKKPNAFVAPKDPRRLGNRRRTARPAYCIVPLADRMIACA